MAWEDVKEVLRPEGVHMGIMKVDPEKCTQCGLCILNCPFKAWEKGEGDVPRLKSEYECFSCYNCMAACPVEAISIVEPYHVDTGFWKTEPHPLPARLPLEPKDAEGNPDQWTAIEEAVMQRRSVRNFKEDPVPEPLIRRVLEAGRFAPSAGNCQPWKFVVITDRELISQMDEALFEAISGIYYTYLDDEKVEGLAPMVEGEPGPKLFDPRVVLGGMGFISRKYAPVSLNAPAVILIAGDQRAISGPELHTGICVQNMNLVANSLGIKSCWVGFYVVLEMLPALKEKLGLAPPWTILMGLVMGYPKFRQEGIVPREFRPVTWFREGSKAPEIEN